jgi:ribonuclease HI
MRIMNIEIRSDSQIIVGQINSSFAAQGEKMSRYLDKVRQFQYYFDRLVLTKIPREENNIADALSRICSGTDLVAPVNNYKTLVKTQPTVSATTEVTQVDEIEPEWAAGIIRYLK